MANIYIKRLEIYGFKSFPYKTVLSLSSGISAIVGPNGAGKSNLLDAIKWVLGEGSQKRLRVKEMGDLIFSANGGRRIDFAEVKLVLSHDPPVLEKFKDLSEITILRRFYRDGVGEFFLNQRPCRLRDIQLLFLELGVSPQGYSIIDQGDVTRFLELSPKERRAFLEDLAGVSKIRFTESEVAKNLEKTELNLLRLKDLIAEVERQHRILKTQVEEAKRYLSLKQGLLLSTIALYSLRENKISERLKETRTKLARLADERTALEQMIATIEEAENQELIAHSEISLKLKALKAESEGLLAEETRLSQSYSAQLREENELKAREEGERLRLASEEERAKKLEQELSGLAAEEERIKARASEIAEEKAKAETRLDELKSKQRHNRAELAKLEETLREVIRQKDRLEAQRVLLERQIQALRVEVSKAEAELSSQLKSKDLASDRLSHIRKKKDAQTKLVEELQETLSQLLAKREEVRQRETKLKEELVEVSARLREAKKSLELLESLIRKEALPKAALREEKKVLGLRYTNLTAEALKILEFALGERLKAIVVSSLAEAEELAKDSDENLIFILEENLPRYDFNNFTLGLRQSLIHSPDGFIYLRRRPKVGLFSFMKERDEIKLSLKELSASEEKLRTELAKAQEEGIKLDSSVRDLKDKMTALEQELSELINSEREAELRYLRAEEQVKRLQDERQKLKDSVAGSESQLAGLMNSLNMLHQEMLRAGSVVKKKRAELEELEKELSKLKKDFEKLDREHVGYSTKLDYLRERRKTLLEERQKALSQARTLRLNLERLKSEHAVHREALSKVKARLEELRARLEDLRLSLASFEAEREARESSLKEVQAKKRETEKRLQILATEIHNLSLSEKELSLLLGRYQEELRLTQEALSGMVDLQGEGKVMESRAAALQGLNEKELEGLISQLKAELKAFSEVNLHSLKEFAEVDRRFQELCRHQADLEKSAAELRRILAELSESARVRLVETLGLVNEKAKEVFLLIFPGAKAELSLVGEDPLTAGLEVRISIPNKNVRNINMLSGGEKTLCVIGFLLSFYLVNPSPFLILDEVDAPLDEKNALRFISLLRIITRESQVLLITHNPQVMKEVDLLIGVTMEEKGISKIVELKLNKDTSSKVEVFNVS